MTNYSPAFLKQIPITLKWEGGYVNDPDDSGGETNFGISKRSYPNLDIRHLTVEEVTAIYWRDYWLANECDMLPNVPLSAAKLFDMAVLMGGNRAARILQGELNRFDNAGLVVDGRLGPLSLAAAQKASDDALLTWLRQGSVAFYNELAADHPVMRKYLHGWLRRAVA